jgi:dolichyl-phosphate-mannose--protein O-mannosyl transferase
MAQQTPGSSDKWSIWLYLVFVIATSFFTYVYRYTFPPHPYWDEPYHIAAAQKYLNGVFFMEQHPPLGKLFIALGEKIVHGNAINDAFINTDYARSIPEQYSFAGYRLFPTIFGWLTAPLLFLVFLFLTGSSPLSALLSFLYIFDNAEIVHTRGAMLDSTLTFFCVLTILLFLFVQDRSKKDIYRHVILSFLFGVSFGLVLTTKLVGLVLILLFPAAAYRLFPDWRRIVLLGVAAFAGFALSFVAVWEVHFALGSKIVPELPDSGYYQLSPAGKEIIAKKQNGSISAFPVLLWDAIKFVSHYNKGVPRLDLCKDDENGSPSLFWPIGARNINYRWEGVGDDTRTIHRYLYLTPNPAGFALGLIGVLGAALLLLAPLIVKTNEKYNNRFFLLLFLALYGGYMTAITTIPRVMYLYHYFVPLIFSYILFGIVMGNLPRIGSFVLTENRRVLIMTLLGLLVFACFQVYRPLTYYEPISGAAIERRNIIPLWDLHCVEKLSKDEDCSTSTPLVIRRNNQ